MHRLRNSGPFILTILLSAMLSPHAHAQLAPIQTGTTSLTINKPIAKVTTRDSTQQIATVALPAEELPDAPGMQATSQQPADQKSTGQKPVGSISGTVLDANGAQIEGGVVTLELTNSMAQPATTTDSTGFFQFTAVESGTFKLKIMQKGFATWVSSDLALLPGQTLEMPPVTLQIASAMTDVDVTFTQHDLANEQIALEEKQRVLGVIPNFYVSYTWNAAPLSAGQKFRLAVRSSVDPVTIGISAIVAGVEQADDAFNGYGQGAQGYAKRFGASYGDAVVGTFIGGAILPSVFHQDPRYFYKGTGTITSRALYAISTVVICKGDNGKWQPNYSNVLGNLAAAGISNIYYPASERNGAGLTIGNALIGTAGGAIGSLFQEFLIKKISRGIPPPSVPSSVTRP
jgi:Carboxypeptidase regulatory-like domain